MSKGTSFGTVQPVAASISRSRQRGVAAVEFAVILPLLIFLIAVPIFFGRCLMHYTVIQKAAHDAAIYLATLPKTDLYTQLKWKGATDLAYQIIDEETAELNPGSDGFAHRDVECDGFVCGLVMPVPKTITVEVRVQMLDDFILSFTRAFIPADGILLSAKVTVPYLGR